MLQHPANPANVSMKEGGRLSKPVNLGCRKTMTWNSNPKEWYKKYLPVIHGHKFFSKIM
jgi:hypothetical protein